MVHRTINTDNAPEPTFVGCGPVFAPLTDNTRSLRQQVFERIRASGLAARVDLAKDLSISAGSATTITSELIENGLVMEVSLPPRDGDPVRGRPPVSLGVRPQAHYVAGIKLSDHRHTAVIVDFAGNLIGDASIVHDRMVCDVDGLLKEADRVLEAALATCGHQRGDLSAVGLGMPGLIDTDHGNLVWSPLVEGRNEPIAEKAHEKFGVPVYVDNDANLATMAELWFGKGRTISDFAVVTIEYGVGMGMVINHRMYRGGLGLGLELGHTKVQLDGALCRCGQRGCLEAYIADYALVREASTALSLDAAQTANPNAMLERLFAQAKDGNEAARSIFARAGRYLALGIANVINLFDPSVVILAGERMRYDLLYADDVLEETMQLTLDRTRKQPVIEINTWGDLVWAHGAAALALSELTDSVLNTAVVTPMLVAK